MSDIKKSVKTAAKIAVGAAGAYYGIGGILCFGALGRRKLNSRPEDALSDAGIMQRYVRDELFREADDWFMSKMPSDYAITGSDGVRLHAEIIKQETESHKWAILNHGYTSRPRTMANQGIHYYKLGYNTVFPYMRGHRNSEHKFCSMGYYERYDIIDWINYIAAVDPEAQIVIHGCSMGAAATMLVTGEKLAKNVKCAVADCGYTDCSEIYKKQIKNLVHLPAFPFINAANSFCGTFLGWNFKECSPLEAVKHSETPTLFIHGENDDFVPYAMLNELYGACAAQKDILSVPDAEHDRSCEVHPELYWDKTDSFVANYIK